MTPIYVLADIHGFIDELDTALALIEADGGPDAEVVFLGDYVDRGPDSRAVIERLSSGVAQGRNWTCLLGNHDRMFLRFLEDQRIDDPAISSGRTWLDPRLGGLTTLDSYGPMPRPSRLRTPPTARIWDAARDAVPDAHRAFLTTRPLTHQTGELLFVHAGIRPEVPLDDQAEDDLVWIRSPFLEHEAPHPWLVVHGHTALDAPAHHGNRVNLDGGTGYGRRLYPAAFEGRSCRLLTRGGSIPLAP
ncbi:metallophosphoesterase family protein [Poseidonocella sedimentorum]|uniref:Serine/threonine protein phosphatase 1 n=1 Tax=Poseidonocella sedimentorum TaxID=871652 RepID=A0A1I6CQ94_9RHOB|nr:metallophosphoesterase family protein [Poseidonocella sedimentorum]SFQ95323.1 serine/threonine protein phosphatase 1 [Poseidonocella sedimentorum]